MMDAAEIARLRAQAEFNGELRMAMPTTLSLLDALEQAQKDAQAARALLGSIAKQNEFALPQDWRARIEAMLDPKP